MADTAKAREVADGVVQVFLPLPMRPTIVNVYLVRGGDGWTLVDTGMNTEDSLARFRDALAEMEIAPDAAAPGELVHVRVTGSDGSRLRGEPVAPKCAP